MRNYSIIKNPINANKASYKNRFSPYKYPEITLPKNAAIPYPTPAKNCWANVLFSYLVVIYNRLAVWNKANENAWINWDRAINIKLPLNR